MPSETTTSPGVPGQREFVLLIAAIMIMMALAIDSMLVALPAIGESLNVDTANHRQYVISVFMLGFGVSQLFVGMLSDRYGRRGLILWAMFAYSLCSVVCATSPSFGQLLVARFVQGLCAAGARVVITSVVRDYFQGRAMAQIMSLASMLFMAGPVVAPMMGQAVMAVASWRWIFVFLGLIGIITWAWMFWRLPESLPPDRRRTLSLTDIAASAAMVVSDRQSVGYSLASTALSCAVMGFLSSVTQIFDEIFKRLDLLVWCFAILAAVMSAASFVNSRAVMRYGMRVMSHGALIGFTVFAGLHAVVAAMWGDHLASFLLLQGLMMLSSSFAFGNLSALAMENLGTVAGMASSLQGSLSTLGGAIVGLILGQMFNGTTVPLYSGLFVCGLFGILAAVITERGRLFNATPHAASPQ